MPRFHCSHCHRPQSVCLCHTIQSIDNLWPVHILQHPNEAKHAIGTARIVNLSLQQCDLYTSSESDQVTILFQKLKEQRETGLSPLLVYPSKESTELEALVDSPPRPLVLLDGTWRKTRRMLHEIPQLLSLETVRINTETRSAYRIRKSPNNSALSTLEAVVQILSTLESDHEKYLPLLDSMQWMINKQISFMGEATFLNNYSQEDNNKDS